MASPTVEDAERAWQERQAKKQYWGEHYQEFLKRWPNQFVAVYKGDVIAVSPDLETVFEPTTNRGLPPQRLWLRFITDDPSKLLP